MKRTVLVGMLFAVSLIAFSQLNCNPAAPETNRPTASESNTNSTREPVDTAAIEAELLRIENDWPRVVKEKDVAAVRRVEADDVVLIDPDGSLRDKTKDIKDIESGALSGTWAVSDLKVNVLNKDAAVVSGRAIVKDGKYTMPDGKSVDISGEYRFIDTFARRNGEWKLVAGVSVPIKQPSAAGSPAKPSPTTAKPSPPPPRASPKPTTEG